MPSSAPPLRLFPSSPTRRSSDLSRRRRVQGTYEPAPAGRAGRRRRRRRAIRTDRKSTRLNSSHLGISYAVFCPPPSTFPLFPYPPLFRSQQTPASARDLRASASRPSRKKAAAAASNSDRSEEHTSELQSLRHLVCRLLPPPFDFSPLPLPAALPISADAGECKGLTSQRQQAEQEEGGGGGEQFG